MQHNISITTFSINIILPIRKWHQRHQQQETRNSDNSSANLLEFQELITNYQITYDEDTVHNNINPLKQLRNTCQRWSEINSKESSGTS
jgi:hypothetical protein